MKEEGYLGRQDKSEQASKEEMIHTRYTYKERHVFYLLDDWTCERRNKCIDNEPKQNFQKVINRFVSGNIKLDCDELLIPKQTTRWKTDSFRQLVCLVSDLFNLNESIVQVKTNLLFIDSRLVDLKLNGGTRRAICEWSKDCIRSDNHGTV